MNDAERQRMHEEDVAAAVLALLARRRSMVVAVAAPERSAWGDPAALLGEDPARSAPGPGAWWAAGLPR